MTTSTRSELLDLQRANLRCWEAHVSECRQCQTFMGRCDLGKTIARVLHEIEKIIQKMDADRILDRGGEHLPPTTTFSVIQSSDDIEKKTSDGKSTG